MMTGVFDASDSLNEFSTASTMDVRFGRGSTSHRLDFMAIDSVRSWMMLAPSP